MLHGIRPGEWPRRPPCFGNIRCTRDHRLQLLLKLSPTEDKHPEATTLAHANAHDLAQDAGQRQWRRIKPRESDTAPPARLIGQPRVEDMEHAWHQALLHIVKEVGWEHLSDLLKRVLGSDSSANEMNATLPSCVSKHSAIAHLNQAESAIENREDEGVLLEREHPLCPVAGPIPGDEDCRTTSLEADSHLAHPLSRHDRGRLKLKQELPVDAAVSEHVSSADRCRFLPKETGLVREHQ